MIKPPFRVISVFVSFRFVSFRFVSFRFVSSFQYFPRWNLCPREIEFVVHGHVYFVNLCVEKGLKVGSNGPRKSKRRRVLERGRKKFTPSLAPLRWCSPGENSVSRNAFKESLGPTLVVLFANFFPFSGDQPADHRGLIASGVIVSLIRARCENYSNCYSITFVITAACVWYYLYSDILALARTTATYFSRHERRIVTVTFRDLCNVNYKNVARAQYRAY